MRRRQALFSLAASYVRGCDTFKGSENKLLLSFVEVKKSAQSGAFLNSLLAEMSAAVLATENCSWLADETIASGIAIIVTAAITVIVTTAVAVIVGI